MNQTAKIIWAALTFSMTIYGAVLYMTEKITHIEMPSGELGQFEILSLASGLMLFSSLSFHKKFVETQKDPAKKFPFYIITWALNESFVVFAMAMTFVSGSGNGFFYVVNLALGILGNILTYPKFEE